METDRKRLALAAGTITSAIFVVLAFRGLQPQQFWNSLRHVSLEPLLVAMTVYFLAVIVISLRWQFLLRAVKPVPLIALTQLVFIGYMGNNVYPLRAGDALRIILLRRNHQVPFVRSTTIVAIERMFDGCVMLTFVLFGLLFIDVNSSEVDAMVSVTTPLFAVAMLLALLLAATPDLLRRVVYPALKVLPQRLSETVAQSAEEIIAGFAGLRSPAHLLGAVISSFVTWGIEAGTYWIVMRAFGLELNYAVALLLVGAVNLAGLIPASPGQVGVNEFVVIAILTTMGISLPAATAYAVVVHVIIWLPITVSGFALLIRQGLGWADIGRARNMRSDANPQLDSA
jgi:uncharacterized protein (TIRG00374 family)